MRSSWGASYLLPAAQVVAEGSWLAVAYAALQAVTGQPPWLGPLELAAFAWAGMWWGRRSRWRSPSVEALGLPLLALLSGSFGWILDPGVRHALLAGEPLVALSLHGAGWLAAIAFWRGEVHRSREDDDAIQDRLLRWAIPGLAIPWAVGHLAAEGALEQDFAAAAFIGTVFFVASAFIAMGLARLEAVRASTGSDWRSNRSWVGVVVVVALAVTLVAVPAAAMLNVPVRSLMVALLGPLQSVLLLMLLLATPIIVVAAAISDIVGPLLPEGITLGRLTLPDFGVDGRQIATAAPVLIFYVVVALILAVELVIVGAILWLRWQERKRMRIEPSDAFEERSIVVPPAAGARPRAAAPRPARQRRGSGPVSAYLEALDLLERDGRWARQPHETPALHAARAQHDGLAAPALARLAAAYQLARYAGRQLPEAERRRAPSRLAAIRRFLRAPATTRFRPR
jgi:hypothetical protein